MAMITMTRRIRCLSSRLLSAAVFLWFLPTGCFWVTTKHEGKELRKDVTKLEKRVQTKEVNLESKIQQLEKVLDQATKVLRRNSADLGADFEAIKEQMRTVEGLIAEAKTHSDSVRKEVQSLKQTMQDERDVLNQRLASMEARLLALEEEAKKPAKVVSPGQLYAQAKAAFDARDYAKARNQFKELVIRYPGHSRADDSQYYRAEAYFKEKDYDAAIREFQKVVDKYKDSPLADDALFRAGEAAQKVKRCDEARAYFGLLRQRYPKSSLFRKAKAKDKELKKNARNRRKCL